LAEKIKQAAYLEGEFILRSGRKSNYYLDKYLFETDPALLEEIAGRLARYVTPETHLIAGAELGGVPLATATALRVRKPFVIVRSRKKDYGTSKPYEGPDPVGKTMLLVEDVVTTAGQVIEAARSLEQLGATVERIVAVIDREEGGRQNVQNAGFPFDALFTKTDLEI